MKPPWYLVILLFPKALESFTSETDCLPITLKTRKAVINISGLRKRQNGARIQTIPFLEHFLQRFGTEILLCCRPAVKKSQKPTRKKTLQEKEKKTLTGRLST